MTLTGDRTAGKKMVAEIAGELLSQKKYRIASKKVMVGHGNGERMLILKFEENRLKWLDDEGTLHLVASCGCGMCVTWESWLFKYYSPDEFGIYIRRNKWP